MHTFAKTVGVIRTHHTTDVLIVVTRRKKKMPNFEERDCENCVHRVPRIREDGGWTADCESWNCEFLSRRECVEAWKEINGGKT